MADHFSKGGKYWLSGNYELHIKALELLTIVVALKVWGKSLRGRKVGWLFCCFTSQVNSYGHCGTVSSPKHTFFLGKLEQAGNQ